MTYTQNEVAGTHMEFIEWADWFLKEQTRRGVPADHVGQMGALLYAFLDSGKVYIVQHGKHIDCPKCQGRGHSNLFLLGQDKPSPCGNCQGTGKIAAGAAE